MVVESSQSRILGWAIAILFTSQTVLLTILPRAEKTSAFREDLRGLHYTVGVILVLLVVVRLWRWFREPLLLTDSCLTPALQSWNRNFALSFLLTLLVAGILGMPYGWSEGRTIHFLGLFSLPALLPQNHVMWMFTGYFHSTAGLVGVTLSLGMGLSVLYSRIRYGIGAMRAFPEGMGVMMISALTIFLYAVNSFKETRSGLIAAAIFLIIVAIIGFVTRNRAGTERQKGEPGSSFAKGFSIATIAALIALACYGPYAIFRVTPWPMGEKVAADPSITWHETKVTQVQISPPTPFEAEAAERTYKWCKFCHTMKAGEKPLVGPNLHNIFGQKAATVPNFYYSEAMAEAGRKGLVWDDKTLSKYLEDPDGFVPGTSMIISSGPVIDPKERAAVINLLKRDTMQD